MKKTYVWIFLLTLLLTETAYASRLDDGSSHLGRGKDIYGETQRFNTTYKDERYRLWDQERAISVYNANNGTLTIELILMGGAENPYYGHYVNADGEEVKFNTTGARWDYWMDVNGHALVVDDEDGTLQYGHWKLRDTSGRLVADNVNYGLHLRTKKHLDRYNGDGGQG